MSESGSSRGERAVMGIAMSVQRCGAGGDSATVVRFPDGRPHNPYPDLANPKVMSQMPVSTITASTYR